MDEAGGITSRCMRRRGLSVEQATGKIQAEGKRLMERS